MASPPHTFRIPQSLSFFRISPAAYLEQNKATVDRLVAGAIVAHAERILLVQRSRHDFGGLCWEIPGGSTESDDVSILGAACRELLEEAGLRAAAVLDLVDENHLWSDDGLIWRKMTFLVEVEGPRRGGDGEPVVTLDPDEHEDFVWATEEEVAAGRSGDRVFTWISEVQRATILKAFGMIKRPVTEKEPVPLEATVEA
jgi:8-oxo-dGTP pyrophosphatase MutT (NUDIX family)